MQILSPYDMERTYGEVFLARSLLRLQLPVDSPAKVRAFQTFNHPELLMTGYRQSLARHAASGASTDKGQKYYSRRRAAMLVRVKPQSIYNYINSVESLLEAWQPVATSIERIFVITMVREAGYLEQMADVFGAMHPNADPANIRRDRQHSGK